MNKSLKQNKKHVKKQSGFTLIEMIVTVAIAAILASIAIPSFTKMIERNRISTGTNEFLSALILARSEAVKRSTNVVICSSTNQTSCAANETEFAKGWIVFPDCNDDHILDTATKTCDTNGDGTKDMKESDAIIKVHGELPQLSIISTTSSTYYIRYQPSGRSTSMSINIGKDSNTPTKKIEVSLTGRVRSSTP